MSTPSKGNRKDNVPIIDLNVSTVRRKPAPRNVTTTLARHQSIDALLPDPRANMTASEPQPHKRLRGVLCQKAIVYGNIANRVEGAPDYSSIRPQPSSQNSFDGSSNGRRTGRTSTSSYDSNQEWFRWTVYVRGAQNEDLSYFIKKVVFVLHETYVNPIRVIESSPFEVTECGWGQFEIKIEIYFHDIPGLPAKQLRDVSIKPPPRKKLKRSASQSMSNMYKRNDEQRLTATTICSRNLLDMCSVEDYRCGNVDDHTMQKLCQEKQAQIIDMFSEVEGLPHDADSDTSSTSSSPGYDNKVVFLHSLRLFAKTDEEALNQAKHGIVEEKYGIIEFDEPYYAVYERLWMGPSRIIDHDHPFYHQYWKHSLVRIAEQEQLLIAKMTKAHRELMTQIRDAKKEYDKLLRVRYLNRTCII